MKKWWLKLLLFLAVVLVMVVTLFSISSIHFKSAIDRCKEQLRAAGEKTTIGELAPSAISPQENGAPLFGAAITNLNLELTVFGYNPPHPMVMVAPGRAMIRWQQPDILNNDATNSWEAARWALQTNSLALEMLQRAGERPRLDFGLAYEEGFLELPNLDELRQAALVLQMSAVEQLHEGDAADAVTNIHTLLALVRASYDEPIITSQMFRVALAQMTVAAQWELLQGSNVTEGELASLQRDWTGLDFSRPLENAFLMDRVMTSVRIEQLRETNNPSLAMGIPSIYSSGPPGDWVRALKDAGTAIKYRTAVHLWRASWSYEDELHVWQFDQISAEALRQARTNGFFKDALAERDRKIALRGLDRITHNWMRNQFTDSFAYVGSMSSWNPMQRLLAVEAARQMAVTSIALKRYQLRQGALPQDLSALVPDFLPALPCDPVDGQPLRYHLNGDGTFLLYSIGEDAFDNGGDPTPLKATKSISWQRGRDWVWPQPASTNEVEYFRAHPPN